MTYSPGKCCKIIIACFILHNMCVAANEPIPDDDSDESNDDDDEQHSGDEDDDNNQNNRADFDIQDEVDGLRVRNNLINTRFRR